MPGSNGRLLLVRREHLLRVTAVCRSGRSASYVPHLDSGDFVIVINAEKAVLTGNKEDEKIYYRQSGRPDDTRVPMRSCTDRPCGIDRMRARVRPA